MDWEDHLIKTDWGLVIGTCGWQVQKVVLMKVVLMKAVMLKVVLNKG